MSEANESDDSGPLGMSKQTLEWLHRKGATIADAVRALRPGGPLDELEYRACCRNCRTEKVAVLTWFHIKEFRCQCGGEFDARPVWAFAEACADGDNETAQALFQKFFNRK